MKILAVFFGGRSVEHDVSVITGVLTVNAIDRQKYHPVPVYISQDGVWYTGEALREVDWYKLKDFKRLEKATLVCGENKLYVLKKNKLREKYSISCAINCMHGHKGEDGCLSGLLEMCGIPLASPSLMPSAICMDKTFTKVALKGLGVATLASVAIKDAEDVNKHVSNISFPAIVKPNSLGSSIGVVRAENVGELIGAVNECFRLCDSVIVEEALKDFIEINCACYKNSDGNLVVSECERPIGANSCLSFDDKYKSGEREFPANINTKLSKKIKLLTEKIYRAFNMNGVIRIDYFVVRDKVYVNEINTVPGSLAYYLFNNTLGGFAIMIDEMVKFTLRKNNECSTLIDKLDTGILNMKGCKSSKRL